MSGGFKQCGCCQKNWGSLIEFLADPQVYYLGEWTVPNSDPIFLFHHSGCGTSVSLSSELLDHHFHQLNQGRTQEAP